MNPVRARSKTSIMDSANPKPPGSETGEEYIKSIDR